VRVRGWLFSCRRAGSGGEYLVGRDENVEPFALGGPQEIAVAQFVPTHLEACRTSTSPRAVLRPLGTLRIENDLKPGGHEPYGGHGFEHARTVSGVIPPWFSDQASRFLARVGRQIFRGKPRSLMTGFSAALPGRVSISAPSVQSMFAKANSNSKAVTRRQKPGYPVCRSAARCLGGFLRAGCGGGWGMRARMPERLVRQ